MSMPADIWLDHNGRPEWGPEGSAQGRRSSSAAQGDDTWPRCDPEDRDVIAVRSGGSQCAQRCDPEDRDVIAVRSGGSQCHPRNLWVRLSIVRSTEATLRCERPAVAPAASIASWAA